MRYGLLQLGFRWPLGPEKALTISFGLVRLVTREKHPEVLLNPEDDPQEREDIYGLFSKAVGGNMTILPSRWSALVVGSFRCTICVTFVSKLLDKPKEKVTERPTSTVNTRLSWIRTVTSTQLTALITVEE